MDIKFSAKNTIVRKSFELPGDKSIAHRSLIIGALGKGQYTIKNFPNSRDCLSTLECMNMLGVETKIRDNEIFVKSPGFENFKRQAGLLKANNSGTTARLLCGLIAGCGISAIIDGDESLRSRPMGRIIKPLTEMGARLNSEENLLPITISPSGKLRGTKYLMPVASAQVKSSILIAGFLSEGETTVVEKESTRDHTERMFKYLNADIKIGKKEISIRNSYISAADIVIPGDISSAAFIIASALLNEDAEIRLENVLLNDRRRSYLDLLKAMGAKLDYNVTNTFNCEETGYIHARSSNLKGITISRERVPDIIDEIPVISVLAAFSRGITIIQGIEELKFKESNRINSIVENLTQMNIPVRYENDSLIIEGEDRIISSTLKFKSFNDHRIAMAFSAAAQRNLGDTIIENWECTSISFPNSLSYFKELLNIDYLL